MRPRAGNVRGCVDKTVSRLVGVDLGDSVEARISPEYGGTSVVRIYKGDVNWSTAMDVDVEYEPGDLYPKEDRVRVSFNAGTVHFDSEDRHADFWLEVDMYRFPPRGTPRATALVPAAPPSPVAAPPLLETGGTGIRAKVLPVDSGYEIKLPDGLIGFSTVLVKPCDNHCTPQPDPSECSVVEGTTVRYASVPLVFGNSPIPSTLLVCGREPVRDAPRPPPLQYPASLYHIAA